MDEILIKKKKFVVESVLAEHPDHTTYVCVYSNVHYMVRVYREGYDKVLEDYKTLKHAGINMAKMDYHDDERKAIAFDYFPEKDILETLAVKPLEEGYFAALFSLYRFARFQKRGGDRSSLAWRRHYFDYFVQKVYNAYVLRRRTAENRNRVAEFQALFYTGDYVVV